LPEAIPPGVSVAFRRPVGLVLHVPAAD